MRIGSIQSRPPEKTKLRALRRKERPGPVIDVEHHTLRQLAVVQMLDQPGDRWARRRSALARATPGRRSAGGRGGAALDADLETDRRAPRAAVARRPGRRGRQVRAIGRARRASSASRRGRPPTGADRRVAVARSERSGIERLAPRRPPIVAVARSDRASSASAAPAALGSTSKGSCSTASADRQRRPGERSASAAAGARAGQRGELAQIARVHGGR